MRHTLKEEYALGKEEYLVAQHFTQQYPYLLRERTARLGLHAVEMDGQPRGTEPGDPVLAQVIALEGITAKIDLIEKTAKDAGGYIAKWLLKGVTEKRSFDNLRLMYGLPCGKNHYYAARQYYYWLLSHRMNKIFASGEYRH